MLWQETITKRVPSAKCLSTSRRDMRGHATSIHTVFDHALLALKCYELTRDSRFLQEGVGSLKDSVQYHKGSARWMFAKEVDDIPPDIDSTAASLLCFKLEDEEIGTEDNTKQFEDQMQPCGGLHTFFGHKSNNDIDPIVNSLVAFLYIAKGRPIPKKLVEYLEKQLALIQKQNLSLFYKGNIYFALRMAKLQAYTNAFSKTKELDQYIVSYKPKNTLERAFLAIAASYRGLDDVAKANVNKLIKSRYSFCTLYRQRTPRFNYGNSLLTTLFALEAIQLHEEGITLVPEMLREDSA